MKNPETSPTPPTEVGHDSKQAHDEEPFAPDIIELIEELDELKQRYIAKRETGEESPDDLTYLNHAQGAAIIGCLRSSEIMPKEVNALLSSLYDVTRASEGKEDVWTFMKQVRPDQLSKLREDALNPLDKIFEMEAEKFKAGTSMDDDTYDQRYYPLLSVIRQTSSEQFGRMDTWRQNDDTHERPQYLTDLAHRSEFPMAYIGLVCDHLDTKELSPEDEYSSLRSAERAFIYNILGIPSNPTMKPGEAETGFAPDLITTLHGRTMQYDKDGNIIPPEKGGGINEYTWWERLHALASRVSEFGLKNIVELYDFYKIPDLDAIPMHNLDTMLKVLQGDEEEIRKIQEGELQVVLRDGLTDHNGAFTLAPKALSKPEDSIYTVYFGLEDPSDIYRPFIHLDKQGLNPSSAIFMAHGNTGFMTFGENYIKARDQTVSDNSLIIEKSSIGRIFSKYMQPNKTTGERNVGLISCNQADEGLSGSVFTTPQALSLQARRKDNVAVSASPESVNILRDESNNIKLKRDVKTSEYRRRSKLGHLTRRALGLSRYGDARDMIQKKNKERFIGGRL